MTAPTPTSSATIALTDSPAALPLLRPCEDGSCPATLALDLIANKWSIRLLDQLLNAEGWTLRFSQLQRGLGRITQRELTRQLREFERAGIVRRKAHPTVPPRVDYTLTELGCSLWQPIHALSVWTVAHAAEVKAHRDAFEKA